MKSIVTQAGFTLVEFIIVIVIAMVLMAFFLPHFIDLKRSANIEKLRATYANLASVSVLIHSTVLVRDGTVDSMPCAGGAIANNRKTQEGTVCTESGLVNLVYGYPAVTSADGKPGVLFAAGIGGSTNSVQGSINMEGYTYAVMGGTARIGILTAKDPENCFFTYSQPKFSGAAAVIGGLTISGC